MINPSDVIYAVQRMFFCHCRLCAYKRERYLEFLRAISDKYSEEPEKRDTINSVGTK